jgi:hypothetical protein
MAILEKGYGRRESTADASRPEPAKVLVSKYDCRDEVLAGARHYNSRTPATLS